MLNDLKVTLLWAYLCVETVSCPAVLPLPGVALLAALPQPMLIFWLCWTSLPYSANFGRMWSRFVIDYFCFTCACMFYILVNLDNLSMNK